MPKTYSELLDDLKRRGQFNIKPGLERVQVVLAALDHPENAVPTIHIAGTNGKGSVAAALESVLRAAGYRTGFYLSPHLIDWLERFRIKGIPISPAVMLAAARRVSETEERLQIQLTHFEFLTVTGFVLMAKAAVDVLILETGMGGRWDATNAIQKPLISVITSIGLDHMQWLGSTEQEIAGEKAGIIKAGAPVVSGVRGPGQAIIRRAARDMGSAFYQLDDDFRAREDSVFWKQGYQTFRYCAKKEAEKVLPFGLLGSHQVDNAAVALRALYVLCESGWKISAKAIRQGLRNVQWPGRFQLIENSDAPPLILDGAHNPHALRQFLETLQESPFGKSPKTFIFSAYRDKDYAKMAAMLLPWVSGLYLCSLPGERGLSPKELRDAFRASRFSFHVCDSPADALQQARRETPPYGVVIGTGSLALVGTLLKAQQTLHEDASASLRMAHG